MPYKVFKGYGGRKKLEESINQWLNKESREVLDVIVTSSRLVIAYRSSTLRRGTYMVRLVSVNRDTLEDDLNTLPQEYERLRRGNDQFIFIFYYDPRQTTPPAQLP